MIHRADSTTLIIDSGVMRQVMERVMRVAQTDVTVLIAGESGVGKELVAQALHQNSRRGASPWVDVNCGAIPEHLFESELFGHEKGAFSGADAAKPGLFELAHGGTLFLDEVGDLDSRVQVKLLRVLDGAPYYRLGGLKKISVNVRVIAATNRDLAEAVEDGRFRRDLFYRLSQIQIKIPPLRERPEDILPIAQHFLEESNPGAVFSPAVRQALLRHSWPGNVRELLNAVQAMAILARGPEIGVQDLPPGIQYPANGTPAPLYLLQGVEEQTILEALNETNGRREKAAALLGISRRTLSRRLKQYGTKDSAELATA